MFSITLLALGDDQAALPAAYGYDQVGTLPVSVTNLAG